MDLTGKETDQNLEQLYFENKITALQYVNAVNDDDTTWAFRQYCADNNLDKVKEDSAKQFLKYWENSHNFTDIEGLPQKDIMTTIEVDQKNPFYELSSEEFSQLITSDAALTNAAAITKWRYHHPIVTDPAKCYNLMKPYSRNTIKKWWSVIDYITQRAGHIHPFEQKNELNLEIYKNIICRFAKDNFSNIEQINKVLNPHS